MFRIRGRARTRSIERCCQARSVALGHGALLGALAAAALLAPAPEALASTGTPVDAGSSYVSLAPAPSVAVDAAGTAYVAWANKQDLSGRHDTVPYCVVPAGASACSHSGTLIPAGGETTVDDVKVLVDGATIAVFADVYGGPSAQYGPLQEWQSTDGGSTFATVDGGQSVGDGVLGPDYTALNPVVVPGTGALGFGWEAVSAQAGYPSTATFSEFPLTSPPGCHPGTAYYPPACPPGDAFALLQPAGAADPIRNVAGQFASELSPTPGVLGVFFTDNSTGPLCPGSVGTAYAYASGAESTTNDYNISPGSANSAWKTGVAQADCNVRSFAVAGGPSGFGVVEDDQATGQTVYHRLDESAGTFAGTPLVTIASEPEQEASVSQDEAGGIYATFLAGAAAGPISLAYSYDKGAQWVGPVTLNSNSDHGAANLSSSVGAAGQGWAVWTDGSSVLAQHFAAVDAFPPMSATTVTTVQKAGRAKGARVRIPFGTTGETDRAVLHGANSATATGTMTYSLFSKAGCSPSSRVLTYATAVRHGAAAPTPPVRPALRAGRYYWTAAYSGGSAVTGARDAPSASACGSEVLTVSPAAWIGGRGSSKAPPSRSR